MSGHTLSRPNMSTTGLPPHLWLYPQPDLAGLVFNPSCATSKRLEDTKARMLAKKLEEGDPVLKAALGAWGIDEATIRRPPARNGQGGQARQVTTPPSSPNTPPTPKTPPSSSMTPPRTRTSKLNGAAQPFVPSFAPSTHFSNPRAEEQQRIEMARYC